MTRAKAKAGATAVPGRLPASLFTLPKLKMLCLESSELASLDGLEKLPALEDVVLSGTPLGDDEEAMAALVAKVKGARLSGYGLERKRTPKPAPKDKAKI